MVRSRRVDSSASTCGTWMVGSSFSISRIEPDVLRLALIVELLAQPRPDLLGDLARIDGRVHAPVEREDEGELLEIGLDRRIHVGILQLAGERRARQAMWRDAPGRARRHAPLHARIARTCVCQSAPSSAAMRRRTKAQPIGGACDWSCASSAA